MSKPSHLVRYPHHLAARLIWSLRYARRPADPAEEAWAMSQLLPGEIELWRRMNDLDRRHSAAVARRFVTARPAATRAEIAGALLHDVGKVDCGLGTWGRVAASLVGGRTERFRIYRDHERIGSEMAAAAGSEQATVDLIAERGPAVRALKLSDHA